MLEPDQFRGRAPETLKDNLADLRTGLISRTPLKGSGILLSEYTDGVEIAVDDTDLQNKIGGKITVACGTFTDFAIGETLIANVTKLTFNSDYFKIHDNGSGEVQISLNTCDASCP
jgi:hypothetical protein